MPLPEDASLVAKPGQDIDVVVLFTKSAAEVDSAKRLIQAAQPDGLLWVAYPKGGKKAGTDLNRDILRRKSASLVGRPSFSSPSTRPGRRCASAPPTWWLGDSRPAQR
ncbi:MAG: hypothetical protein JF888_11920 [Candidatus Dormibacteraeota bacterium]|uniref:DUF3052 domain-containing protein n=1 Tax=Candidatus Dormiibacter inghamiae TaxID=3127013 RepID=A0A934KJD6_9BACT|nr:hypothetical protein [Candidatus Dormibacteraeota bacterium]MBJ7606275.1 hypothetical protein [Candidatus Dormibacteraeota bacterium]